MEHHSASDPGIAGRWIALVIRLFPEGFRRDYGNDLLGAFEDQLQDAVASATTRAGRAIATATTVSRVTVQIVRAAIAERRSRRPPPVPEPPLRERNMISTILSDVRYAVRGYLKQPGFTLVAVVTLALGIGACTAIFSVVNGILLTPLPYPNPDQLVSIRVNSGIDPDGGFYGTSEPEYWDFSNHINSLAEVGVMSGIEVTLGDSTGVRRIRVMRASATMLPMLGVNPALGRYFTPEEDRPGSAPAIVLSYGMWQSEFGGDPGVLGRTLTFDVIDQPLTIVGVMPAGFRFPDESWEAWVPLGLDREDPWARNNHYMNTLGRLAPNVTLEAARTEMDLFASRATDDYPEFYPDPGLRIKLEKYQRLLTGDVTAPLFILLGAVGFVVLMASVNVANLLLARGETRKREIAIRNAVGASDKRVAQQLITENLFLAALGGLFGAAVAYLGTRALLALAPRGIPRLTEVGLDARVLGFSMVVTLGTGLVFGVMPALQASRCDVQDVIKEGGGNRGTTRSSNNLRRVLVATQVTLAMMLASGAGLMLRTVSNMYGANMGFSTDNIVTFELNPSASRYDSGELRVAYYDGILEQIEVLPGVNSAAAVFSLPLEGGTNNWSILIEGQEAATVGDAPAARVQICTPDYFETLGLTLLRGRLFDENDIAGSPPVVVISETMARAHWPNEDPLGKQMKVYDMRWPWLEVIGVVKDVRHYSVSQEPRSWWYVPYAQAYETAYYSPRSMYVAVQSDVQEASLIPAIRDVVNDRDSSVPISRLQTMEQVFAAAIDSERFTTVLLVVFGTLALFLASIGVYGVISYTVSSRTHEIGLRMALGAPGAEVLSHTVREGLLISAVGMTLGVAGSLALSRSFATVVYGISPTDPATYVGVVAILILVASAASFFPAIRASRVDPMVALRVENR